MFLVSSMARRKCLSPTSGLPPIALLIATAIEASAMWGRARSAGSRPSSVSSSSAIRSNRARALGSCDTIAMSSLFWLMAPARPTAIHNMPSREPLPASATFLAKAAGSPCSAFFQSPPSISSP